MAKREFKVSAEIKNILGKDLITDDFVAIFELVKNSYDAYATNVVIEFQDDAIIISDNGHGMSEDDIVNKWLFLGYSEKKNGVGERDTEVIKQMTNKVRRHYAGAKGIGRLSCDRIASALTLTSKDIGSGIQHTVEVDWTRFDNIQHKEFGSIEVDIKKSTKFNIYPRNAHSGTILHIHNLHSEWTREKILDLKKSLEKLINPFKENSDFTIQIIAQHELEKDQQVIKEHGNDSSLFIVNGIISNRITEVLILKSTKIETKLTKGTITSELWDRGEKIYEIEEENIDFPNLEEVTINLFFLNRSAKNNFTRLMGVPPTQYGSVFMFRNGFRVFPYGEAGDDSWGLDKRALQGYNRFLGTRDLFGRVDIVTDQIDNFKEASSRDSGLIQTETSDQLMEFFFKVHKRLERYVTGVLWGASFKKEYFIDDLFADENRNYLKDNDQLNNSPSAIYGSLGSKIDYLLLVKSLVKDKNVKVIYSNEKLLDIFAKSSDIGAVNQKIIEDVKEFAKKNDEPHLHQSIQKIRVNLSEVISERDKAEEELRLEIEKRFKAEQAKEEEERLRKIAELNKQKAEQKAKEAELKKREADFLKLVAEKKHEEEARLRKEAQLKKQVAEQNAKEAELRKREALIRHKEEHEKRLEVQKELEAQKESTKYFQSARNLSSEVEDMIHLILISSTELDALSSMMRFELLDDCDPQKLADNLDHIQFHVEKIQALTKIITKADAEILKDKTRVNLVEYLEQYMKHFEHNITVDVQAVDSTPVYKKISILSLIVVFDNLISNARKAKADKISINIKQKGSEAILDFSDNGIGVDLNKFTEKTIFYKGVTNRTGGFGIGLGTIKEVLNKNMNGNIEFVGNGYNNLKGATFRIYLK